MGRALFQSTSGGGRTTIIPLSPRRCINKKKRFYSDHLHRQPEQFGFIPPSRSNTRRRHRRPTLRQSQQNSWTPGGQQKKTDSNGRLNSAKKPTKRREWGTKKKGL
ncbi:hypothetical protein Zmor_003734 [Zophobas morio]|uniref:Uncharacterized protein n=1 Tax=Zophobas morio TaxID=2755281 RepID=A0AA38HSS1_9CUCU|nr:hypothetical protein Zmor_003734 [Zophobas morio]